MSGERSMIGCRFCPWKTPAWSGRSSGWPKLAAHIAHRHEDVKMKVGLICAGTTGKGMDVLRRQEDRR
jgi:hypothetical protein